jgi:tetratricopeptide (TPR) repeat protein
MSNKLRGCFSAVQYLFAGRASRAANLTRLTLLAGLIGCAGSAFAQAPKDRVVFRDGQVREGKVLGVSGANLQIQIDAGTIGLPLAAVAQITMQPPPGAAEAEKAFAAGNFPSALAAAKGVADRFAGLPTDWARRCALMVAECHIALDDLAKAETALADFQKRYPGQGSAMADFGAALIAFAKKDYAAAKEKLAPIAEQALKTFRPDEAAGRTYGRAFLTLGKIAEAEGDYPSALEHYLRTVTIFFQDPAALAQAKERADAVRKEHGTMVP